MEQGNHFTPSSATFGPGTGDTHRTGQLSNGEAAAFNGAMAQNRANVPQLVSQPAGLATGEAAGAVGGRAPLAPVTTAATAVGASAKNAALPQAPPPLRDRAMAGWHTTRDRFTRPDLAVREWIAEATSIKFWQ